MRPMPGLWFIRPRFESVAGHSANEIAKQFGQRSFVPAEAGDGCAKHGFGIEPLKVKRMAYAFGQDRQERQLCAAVALAEWMDRVQFGQEMRSLFGECSGINPTKCFCSDRSANSRRISRSMCSG